MSDIYALYEKNCEKRNIVNLTRVKEVGRTLKPIWGDKTPDEITLEECDRFVSIRTEQGCTGGGIRNDLAYITAALNHAKAAKVIKEVPKIPKPPAGRPRDRYLTRDELVRLIDNAVMIHVKLFIILAVTTAGRPKHLLELTWDRVDLKNRIINLDNPERDRTRKGRACVPINETGYGHLVTAHKLKTIENVIELDGKAIKSIRNGVLAAAGRAALTGVSQYVLRHTAGVYMAQAGVPMEEIAEYMGHTSVETTRKHYARFGPEHLRKAARALEFSPETKNDIRCIGGSDVPSTMNDKTSKGE